MNDVNGFKGATVVGGYERKNTVGATVPAEPFVNKYLPKSEYVS